MDELIAYFAKTTMDWKRQMNRGGAEANRINFLLLHVGLTAAI